VDDDGKLLQRYLAGEAAAFDELVKRHQRHLFAFIRQHVPDRPAAEDVLQETFMRMLTHISQYRHQGRLHSWLFRIAHNLIVDEHRKRRGASFVSLDESRPGENGGVPPLHERLADSDRGNPAFIAQRNERAEAAVRALALLPPAQREVFMLRQAGLSFREIARVQGCPLNTALGRMHDALEALRQQLEPET
jgi:RNA polymerase sigma-70 factor (ECF subfamily)